MMSAMMKVHAPGAFIHSTFLFVVTGWPRLCSGEPPFWGTSGAITAMPGSAYLGTKQPASEKHLSRQAAFERRKCKLFRSSVPHPNADWPCKSTEEVHADASENVVVGTRYAQLLVTVECLIAPLLVSDVPAVSLGFDWASNCLDATH